MVFRIELFSMMDHLYYKKMSLLQTYRILYYVKPQKIVVK